MPFIISSRGGAALVLSSKYNIGQADFTDWMSFQPSNLIQEINPHPKSLNTNTYRLESAWNSWKEKKLFKYEYFNIADWILECNFKSCKEIYSLPHVIGMLRRGCEVFMVSSPHKVWAEFFPKNVFHGGTFLGKLMMVGGGRGGQI